MNRLVLIDAHPLAYRSYHSPGTRNLKNSAGRMSGAFYGFLRSYLTLRKRFSAAHFLFCFDSGRSWRNEVFAGYKTHAEEEKPNGFLIQLRDARRFLEALGVPCYSEPLLEADDLISVFACEWVKNLKENTAVVVSSDRDFFQLVSDKIMVYDDRAKKFFGPAEVEKESGVPLERFLMYKCLIGDVADKIPGVAGYGPVKARKFCIDSRLLLQGSSLETFYRNKRLMNLPRSPFQLTVPGAVKLGIAVEIKARFLALSIDEKPVTAIVGAQKLLDTYECKSIKPGDFF